MKIKFAPSTIYGKMHSADKSADKIKIFKNLIETSTVKPDFTVEVLAGATVVQAVFPMRSTNFEHYYRNEFTTYLFNKRRHSNINRVDIVSDIELDHSIKNSTRNKKGW